MLYMLFSLTVFYMSSCILSVILCLTSGVYVNNNAILTFHEGHNCIFLFIVVEHHFCNLFNNIMAWNTN
jgi:hypothetical protein